MSIAHCPRCQVEGQRGVSVACTCSAAGQTTKGQKYWKVKNSYGASRRQHPASIRRRPPPCPRLALMPQTGRRSRLTHWSDDLARCAARVLDHGCGRRTGTGWGMAGYALLVRTIIVTVTAAPHCLAWPLRAARPTIQRHDCSDRNCTESCSQRYRAVLGTCTVEHSSRSPMLHR